MSAEQIQFSPSGPMRQGQVYVSRELLKSLRYAAKREECTVEDLYERVLNGYLAEKHPAIVAWVAKRESEEKEFVKTLKPNKANE
jgi:rubrerythrin